MCIPSLVLLITSKFKRIFTWYSEYLVWVAGHFNSRNLIHTAREIWNFNTMWFQTLQYSPMYASVRPSVCRSVCLSICLSVSKTFAKPGVMSERVWLVWCRVPCKRDLADCKDTRAILGMGSANERRRYNVNSFPISLAHTPNPEWSLPHGYFDGSINIRDIKPGNKKAIIYQCVYQ